MNKIDMHFAPGGTVTSSHKESQKVWWKPWTWLREPVTVITEMDVKEISIIHTPANKDSIPSMMDLCEKKFTFEAESEYRKKER